MSLYIMPASLKEKRKKKKMQEELIAENKAMKEKQAELEASMTDLQVALCSLYEQAEGSEAE